MVDPDVVALHLGNLHPFEQALTLVLAFGPFVVLGLVIRHQRREPEPEVLPVEPTTRDADPN